MTLWDKFLHDEDVSRDVIGVKRIYIKMAGDVASGVMLSQIIYWFLPSKRGDKKTTIEFDGEDWIAKKLSHWDDECAMTPDQARRCLKVLEDKGFIVCKVKKHNGTPTTHIRLNKDAVLSAHNGGGTPNPLGQNPKSEVVETPSPDGQEPNSYNKEKTTTETTAEIKTIATNVAEVAKDRSLEVVTKAFEYYCKVFGHRPTQYTLTPVRRDKALLRLKERTAIVGFDEARREFKVAIDNLSRNEHCVTGGYTDWLAQIFKSAEEFEKRVNWRPSTGTSQKQQQEEKKINDTNNSFAQTDRYFGINQGPAEIRTPQVVPGQVRALLESPTDNAGTDSGLVRGDPALHG